MGNDVIIESLPEASAVIKFFALEGKSLINIFKRLKKVYGEAVIGYSTVEKWLFRIKGEEEDLSLSDPETNKEVEEHHRRLMLEILCYDRKTDQRKS